MQSTIGREVRVFVSSTFRDMQAERDALVRTVFPQLRHACESRSVTWGEVDLRWGITDESAAERGVLTLCLDEIERCRPFFIGMLGDRYGWVPPGLPADLIQQHPWLAAHHGRSVTELEILHGVLLDPAMHGRAFFYFRDDHGAAPPDREEADRLSALKARIRAARDAGACHLREHYRSAAELGTWVLADFTALIDTLFPLVKTIDPVDRAREDHAAVAASRSHVYLRRDADFARLTAYLSDNTPAPFVIAGESGLGKSSLVANWAAQHEAAHPDDLLFLHFIGTTPDSADWTSMIRRLLETLKRRFGWPDEVPDAPFALSAALGSWINRVPGTGRVVILLDGLDQLADRDGARSLLWIPPLPRHVRLIVSARPGPLLDVLQARAGPVLRIAPLTIDERARLIDATLARSAKALSVGRATRIAAAPASANARYLCTLLDELRVVGDHARLDSVIASYLGAASTQALYRLVLARYDADYTTTRPGLVADALRAVWAARRGLSEVELLDLLGTAEGPLPRAVWSPFFLAADAAFINRSGVLDFSNDDLRAAVLERHLPTEDARDRAHNVLIEYFAFRQGGPRMLDELPWQAATVRAWAPLQAMLCDLPCLVAMSLADDFEPRRWWGELEAHGISMRDAYRSVVDDGRADPDARFVVAMLLQSRGHWEDASRMLQCLAETFGDRGDERRRALCLVNVAVIARRLHDGGASVRALDEVRRVADSSDDLALAVLAANNHAVQLRQEGRLDEAMREATRAEDLARAIGQPSSIAAAIGEQAAVLDARGDVAGALALAQRAEAIYAQTNDAGGLLATVGNQAGLLQRLGRLEASLALYVRVEALCRADHNPFALQQTLYNQAVLLILMGDRARAAARFHERARVCEAMGRPDPHTSDELIAMIEARANGAGRRRS